VVTQSAGVMLLIEKGLMFGNLFPVTSPALVERYNRALHKLTGRRTALPEFHIDLSGYAPEIGDELGDDHYLNRDGSNRQFILLSTEQRTAPLLNAKFSHSRPILRRFIDVNEAALFALTARDAVCGELANSVFDLSSPQRLFDIRRITVEADTTGNHLADATRLAALVDRFKTKADAWWDDVLIAQMIELAKTAGDVTRQPVAVQPLAVDQGNFWTSHFGGLYIFRDVAHPAAISVGPKAKLGALPIAHTFDLTDRNMIARFLEMNDLVEPIVKARGIDAVAILGQKMDFVLVEAAAQLGLDLRGASRADLRNVARQVGSALPDEFTGLAALKRWAEGSGPWPRISSEHPAYFYTLRSRPHADRDLVNQLLAELSPLDIRQLFICHKELFYDHYRTWSPDKQRYVARFLETEYLADKDGAREALFGGDAPMAEPPPARTLPEGKREQVLIDLVGPWGALRRKR
jgi:hypothetical protein